MYVPFDLPPVTGGEIDFIRDAINSHKVSGDGKYTAKCSEFLQQYTKSDRVLITTSCTHATEMAAILIDIKPGDEVIMPSYTFVSTANAFVLRGAVPVFVDIRPDTMNIDEKKIEDAITQKTKAIVVVHYAGIACEMDMIMRIANDYGLAVVEDAAQAVGSTYNGIACGSIGDYGCFSFHETKNIIMGEGGALLIREKMNIERAEIIREKGTDRTKFYRGETDKYTWLEAGSSYLPSELNAAYLYAQLLKMEEINKERLMAWEKYNELLTPIANDGYIDLPLIPKECKHNGHMFFIKVKDLSERTRLIEYMKQNQVDAVFHYIPLHSAPGGRKYGYFHGEDKYTTKESERLIRLPIFYGITYDQVEYVVETIRSFFGIK